MDVLSFVNVKILRLSIISFTLVQLCTLAFTGSIDYLVGICILIRGSPGMDRPYEDTVILHFYLDTAKNLPERCINMKENLLIYRQIIIFFPNR